ncbi:MAG: 4-hydroxy-tetrahydrodipicolinate reductase [Gammaproteobacteria bacterium]
MALSGGIALIRVFVNGASGKMGQATVKAVQDDPALQIVGQAGSNDALLKLIRESQADVVVDFTLATVGFQNACTIIEAGARPVIGTSGITADQVKALTERCAQKKLGGIIAPNFAIGAVLMMKYAQDAARYLPDAEIIEMHHPRKIDAPSGTALRTAEMMAEMRNTAKMSTQQAPSRGMQHHGIPIHAVRLPGLIARQSVILGGLGQTLTLEHNTLDREAFMPGVCLACQKVMGLNQLVYGLEHIL